MDLSTLILPIESTKVNLEADSPTGHGRYDVTYHGYDALAAPAVRKLPDGRWVADFSTIAGRLAERFEPSADYGRWVVQLRQGVKSHAGNELTSEDVVWSFQRSFAFRGVGMWRASIMGGILPADGVKALDRYRVEFLIDGANPVLPRFLCFHTTAIVDSTEARKHVSGDQPWAIDYLAKNLCGFGGWSLGDWTDDRLVFRPRADFFLGAPPVNGVVFRATARGERLDQFERGALNFLYGLQPDEVKRLEKRPDVRFIFSRTNHSTIEMDHSRPPFSDHGVREAVLRTVPYERIIKEAYLGLAEVQHGIYQPVTPEFSADDWTYWPDIERSRALVKTAGAEGAEVTFAVGRTSESPVIGTIVAEALAGIGLKVKVKPAAELGASEVPEMYLREDCSHGIADPHYDLAIDFAPPRGMPMRYFPGRRLSKELRDVRTAPAERQAMMYRDIQRDLLADATCVPLAGHSFPIAYQEGLNPWFFSAAYLPFSHFLYSAHRW